MSKSELVERVTELVKYPEIEGETTLEEWIEAGDCDDMTPEEIAAEWDWLSSQAESDD